MHEPFEHVEQRALEMSMLKQRVTVLEQAVNAIAEVVKDEPEAKQPVQAGPTALAQVVHSVVVRLKRNILVAQRNGQRAELPGMGRAQEILDLERKTPGGNA